MFGITLHIMAWLFCQSNVCHIKNGNNSILKTFIPFVSPKFDVSFKITFNFG
jgi:hypothetical protein